MILLQKQRIEAVTFCVTTVSFSTLYFAVKSLKYLLLFIFIYFEWIIVFKYTPHSPAERY